MGPLLAYNLQAAVYLAVLYLVYKLVLSGEKQPVLNRAVIFGIVAAAFSAEYIKEAVGAAFASAPAATAGGIDLHGTLLTAIGREEAAPVWPVAAIWIYTAGIGSVAAVTVWQYLRLRRLLASGERFERDGYTLVVVDNDSLAPFSWGRHVVISARDHAENAGYILAHELAHIRARHTLDMLVMQLVCCLQWFNPAVWLLRSELQTVHEYQADARVLSSGAQIKDYQMLLIKKAVGTRLQSLANSLNHSNLKKRITMMYKCQSTPARRLRTLVLAPALGLAFALAGSPLVSAAAGCIAAASAKPARATAAVAKTPTAKKSTAGRVAAVQLTPATKSAAKTSEAAAPAAKQTLAEFPGGEAALFKYLGANVMYPASAVQAGREGNVLVKFTINADGSIVNVNVMKSVDPALDAEAVRVISSMPKWTPATSDGKAVNSEYALPVNFKLWGADKKKAGKPSPVIMVDGKVFTGDLNSIDPNQIEHMEVVKDRSEYPDGLIVITLKK